MRKSKHVRNQTGGRHAKARSARAHSERNGRPRGAFARLMPGRPKAWHMLALTCLTVGVYLIVTSGSVPLGVKLGDFLMPLRLAITGSPASPPLFGAIRLLGEQTALARVESAILLLG